MKIIIIGCGRWGAGLARVMIQDGHAVTVIDKDPKSFQRLGSKFKGKTLTGSGDDREILIEAGVENADGLATVTESDEHNIVIARVAKLYFHVPRVIARLHDPEKAEIYKRLGLQTIAPTAWGINRIAELLRFSGVDSILSLGSGQVDLVEIEISTVLAGRTVNDLSIPGEIHVVTVTRGGRTFLPTLGTEFSDGDQVSLAVQDKSMNRLKTLLGMA